MFVLWLIFAAMAPEVLSVLDTDELDPMVELSCGEVQGAWKQSFRGRKFASFEGIPYAAPPIGKDRFREPKPAQPWFGVWDAVDAGAQCLQYEPVMNQVTGSEDCLFLNVYTPMLSPASPLPVLVFIHGGAFMYGGGDVYNPLYLMDKDLIVVTFNYRLGPLGFLSTGDEEAPGNAGLKDQAFALRWVKDNIQLFGGEAGSITLAGHSSGAASVHYHYLSPVSRGTFARAIAFSGSAFAPWAYSVKPVEKAKQLASLLDCPTASTRKMVDCLKATPGQKLVNATTNMLSGKYDYFTSFTPTAEGPTVKRPFLTQDPYQASKEGVVYDAPLIMSVCKDEGLYPAAAFLKKNDTLDDVEDNWKFYASDLFHYNDTLPLDLHATVADKIKEHYLGGMPVSMETFTQLVQAVGDRNFASNVGLWARSHALRAGQPARVYRYAYRGETSFSLVLSWDFEDYGVSHADDLLHIFRLPFLAMEEPDDMAMTDAFVDMIYSFATTGVPKFSEEAPDWLPVTPGSSELNYLEISSAKNLTMETSSDFGQLSFWDSLGFRDNSENLKKLIRFG